MINKNLSKAFASKISKVYKHNKLNNANFGNLTLNDYQVFLHLINNIGGVDKFGKYLQPEEMQREHLLSAKEFHEIFNTDLSNAYKILYKSCKKFMKTSITLEKIELKESWEINICSMAKYNRHHGTIVIKFTDDIMPYLAQVKEKFVLYNIKEISNFGSIYTIRLYELIQEFKETGWLLKSVEQLRVIFAVDNKFKAYKDFKNYTFYHACKEINANYDINLNFEEIKEGRKIVAIKFLFKKTVVNKVVSQKGVSRNIYIKPKPITTINVKPPNRVGTNLTEPLDDAKELNSNNVRYGPTSIKKVLNSMLLKWKLRNK